MRELEKSLKMQCKKGGHTNEKVFMLDHRKTEYAYKNNEVLLASLLEIEGASDNTFLQSIIQEPRRKGIGETSCRSIDCVPTGYSRLLRRKE